MTVPESQKFPAELETDAVRSGVDGDVKTCGAQGRTGDGTPGGPDVTVERRSPSPQAMSEVSSQWIVALKAETLWTEIPDDWTEDSASL